MRKYLLRIIFVFYLSLCLSGFAWSQTGNEKNRDILFAAAGFTFPYDLKKPDVKVTLPNDLIEISGLCWMSPGKLACVQDEDGIIFIYDLNKQAIAREIEFEDDGDYEGIELMGEDAWILKSNGNLYKVNDWMDDEKRSTEKYETELSKKNDCEGLGYDPASNSLLIACKGHPRLDDEKGNSEKAIYRFDLKEKDLIKKPVYTIDLDQVKNYKKYNTMTTWGVEILSMLDESKGDVSFQPSGIAIHPLTGNLYVTGAVGDMILVLHPRGEILAMIALDTAKFRQPEGICFDPQGNLYISNEGKDSRANLMKFNYNK
jgi:uncharacterized protein YjiK